MSIEKLRSRPSLALFSAVLLAFCEAGSPTAAQAGVNAWTQVGPEGAGVCALAVAPSETSFAYAVVGNLSYWEQFAGALFRSADGGRTWEPTGAAVGESACLLSVDAADPRRLYAVHMDRVVRSLDGGATWTTVFEGVPLQQAAYPIAVTPEDPAFLLFANDNEVYRSLDRGDTWQQTWSSFLPVQSVAIHPSIAGRAFALTRESGLFFSQDHGLSWSPSGTGLPTGLALETLQFDPKDPSLLFLLTRGGVYRSRTGGTSWSLVLPSTGDSAGLLAIGADSAVVVQLQADLREFVASSHDGGESWQDLGSPFPLYPRAGFSDLAPAAQALLGASPSGIVRSHDGGTSWQTSNSGLRALTIYSFDLDRQNPERLYGLGSRLLEPPGFLRSLDAGASWQDIPVSTALGLEGPSDFLVDPSDSRHLVVRTNVGSARGVSASFDGGATWDFHEGPETCLRLTELKIDPLQSSRLFLSGTSESHICTSPDCWNWRSDDSGQSWQCAGIPAGEDVFRRIEPSPFEPGVVLALGYLALYRSVNSGQDWTQVAGPPEFLPSYFSDVRWASPEIAYATSGGYGGALGSAIFVSHDSGRTWAPDPPPPAIPERPWLTSLVVDPFHPQTIAALAMPSGSAFPREVVRSRDGGRTWATLSEGLPGQNLSELTIDPVTPNRLYVSAAHGGLLAYDVQEPEPCVPSPTALCITDGRFKIESLWRDFAGRSGVGHAVPLASDTGAFWFFDPDNLELFAKEIDGVSYNNAFWTFYGALSNVEFTLLATDTATGAQHGYFNRSTQFASLGDIESFPQELGVAASYSRTAQARIARPARAAAPRSANACVPDATTLCLQDGRFAASVTWRDFAGRTGVGTPIVLTPDTGSFWFFDAGIHELAVKVIDGRSFNDAFWVFYGSLSNVEFELTVIDTTTGDVWTRENPSGTFASNGDIEAFPQLP